MSLSFPSVRGRRAHPEGHPPLPARSSDTRRRWGASVALAAGVAAAILTPAPAQATTAQTTVDAPGCSTVTIPVSLPGLSVQVHGTLCHPGPLDRPGPVEVLTSGATYNSDYWFGEGVASASFVAQASKLSSAACRQLRNRLGDVTSSDMSPQTSLACIAD